MIYIMNNMRTKSRLDQDQITTKSRSGHDFITSGHIKIDI